MLQNPAPKSFVKVAGHSHLSRRTVPIHPELFKLGFGTYLAERRKDEANPQLFPEFKQSKLQSHSDLFGCWSANFLRNVFGEKIEAPFHSFRHPFTDACRQADIPPQRIDRLTGWAEGGSRQQRHYGDGQPLDKLAEAIRKIQYKELDLSHLHVPEGEALQTFAVSLPEQTRIRRRRPVS